MHRNILIGAIIGSLAGGAIYFTPTNFVDTAWQTVDAWYASGSATHVDAVRGLDENLVVLPPDSQLYRTLTTPQDCASCHSPSSGNTTQAAQQALKPGMCADEVRDAMGEPIARSEDGRRLYYKGVSVILNNENALAGWVEIDAATLERAKSAQRIAVIAGQDHPVEMAGRMANIPQTSGGRSAVSDDSFSSRNVGSFSSSDRVRRTFSRSTVKPSWLRAFSRSLDQTDHRRSGTNGVDYSIRRRNQD